ncbi:MAG: kelch repeat-containing protein [Bacteroidota bacterium]
MKTAICQLLLALLPIVLLAQSPSLTFVDVSSLDIGRSALTSASDGENIYLANGFTTESSFSDQILRYNIASDEWSVINTTRNGKRFASLALIDNKLYVFNGRNETGEIHTELEIIDLSDGSISSGTQPPVPTKAGGVADWEGKLYSFGGQIDQLLYSNKLTVFDPATNTWTELADMPVSLETKGKVINGVLYVFGGFNGSVSNRIDKYDIATDTWTFVGSMPTGISAQAVATEGNRIWLVGDFTNQAFLAYFDVNDESFHLVTSNLIARRHAAAEVIDGSLYAIGGNTNSNISSAIDNVQVAEVVTSTENLLVDAPLALYPNPSSDLVQFSHSVEELRIYDINGRLVQTNPAPLYQLDISHLPSGQYFLIGRSNDKRLGGKLLKQ